MQLPLGKPGVSRFIFVALLLAFNWPLLSIPSRNSLLGWLFFFWGLTIALLFIAAHWNGAEGANQADGEGADQAAARPEASGPEASAREASGPAEPGAPEGPGGPTNSEGMAGPAGPEGPGGGGV